MDIPPLHPIADPHTIRDRFHCPRPLPAEPIVAIVGHVSSHTVLEEARRFGGGEWVKVEDYDKATEHIRRLEDNLAAMADRHEKATINARAKAAERIFEDAGAARARDMATHGHQHTWGSYLSDALHAVMEEGG